MGGAPTANRLLDEEFANILVRAYGAGSRSDYDALSSVFESVTRQTLGQAVGGDQLPMEVLVGGLIDWLYEAGSAAAEAAASAFYRALPANRDLRSWVTARRPHLAELVSEAEFLTAERALQESRVASISSALVEIQKAKGFAAHIGALAREDLATAAENLGRLAACKGVHDTLHGVQTGAYAELWPLQAVTVPTPEDEFKIQAQVAALETARVRLGVYLLALESDPKWVTIFDDAVRTIGLKPFTAGSFRGGLYKLRGVLRLQMMTFDQRIVAVADDIPFSGVIDFLRKTGKLGDWDDAALKSLDAAADDLTDLNRVLRRTLELHRSWQIVDLELWVIEQELDIAQGAHGQLQYSVEAVSSVLDELRQNAPDMWDPNVAQSQLQVQHDLILTEPGAATAALKAFVRICRLQFLRVDKAVLEQCTKIDALRAPIEQLLKET